MPAVTDFRRQTMAKRAKSKSIETKPVFPQDTSQLLADTANPRKIRAEASAGLGASLHAFGDLSGIVFNQRTNTLVCGHQRLLRIRAQWGDRPIELIDPENGIFGIRIDQSHYFSVRMVDWSQAKQRAANAAANNKAIQGEFTEDVGQYLLSIADDLSSESPALLDDVLLTTLIGESLAEESALQRVKIEPIPTMTWCLIGLPTVHWGKVSEVVERLAEIPGIVLEMTSDDGERESQ